MMIEYSKITRQQIIRETSDGYDVEKYRYESYEQVYIFPIHPIMLSEQSDPEIDA